MRIFHRIIFGTCVLLLSQVSWSQIVDQGSPLSLPGISTKASVAQKANERSIKTVGNAEISATLVANGEKLEIRGRSSFKFDATDAQLERGIVSVEAMNVIFFDVPQALLNYRGQHSEETGTLSFTSFGGQELGYDIRKNVVFGDVKGNLGASFMSAFENTLKDSEDGDHTEIPVRDSSMRIEMKLNRPLTEAKEEELVHDMVEMDMRMHADNNQFFSAYEIDIMARPIYEIEWVITWIYEFAQNLCVQPVRFSRLVYTFPGGFAFDYTGDGLAFGQPEANKQWRKADVTFTWRPWKTIYNPTLFFFSTGESAAVRATVTDDDCIEVFFVEGDNGMHNSWGGGATWGSGTANSQVISSDGNAALGIDQVHLAHELGHVLDLSHPGWGSNASSNTLMCPSGFANDNPDINSQENKNNVSNPLLTFSLKILSAGPDCTNSADCGACPPIP